MMINRPALSDSGATFLSRGGNNVYCVYYILYGYWLYSGVEMEITKREARTLLLDAYAKVAMVYNCWEYSYKDGLYNHIKESLVDLRSCIDNLRDERGD